MAAKARQRGRGGRGGKGEDGRGRRGAAACMLEDRLDPQASPGAAGAGDVVAGGRAEKYRCPEIRESAAQIRSQPSSRGSWTGRRTSLHQYHTKGYAEDEVTDDEAEQRKTRISSPVLRPVIA